MYFETISNVIFSTETSRTAMASNQQIGGYFKTFYEFKLKINNPILLLVIFYTVNPQQSLEKLSPTHTTAMF